jgi:outer membrane lipoprotein carrier protein
VEQARGRLETLAGEFTQRKRLSLFRDELSSKGLLRFKRPSRLRWEYTAPDRSVVVFDGARVTVRVPPAPAEVYDLARQPGMRALFEQLLSWLGRGSLRAAAADYDLAVAGPRALRLTPKGPLARHILDVELRFGATYELAFVRLRERNGDCTEITFTSLRRNVFVEEASFKP